MFDIIVDGRLWSYAFLNGVPFLGEEDREHIVASTARMYTNNETRRTLKGLDYEGVMKTDKGKFKVSFLVSDPMADAVSGNLTKN